MEESMGGILSFTDKVSWELAIVGCLTLGLAPFAPPHIVEKLQMLFNGELKKAIDWFDLAFHGAPWIVLILKSIATFGR